MAPPSVKGFSVLGPKNRAKQVFLFFEEYETIRLLDYDNLTQEEAAVCMEVSRPTLTRIYEAARNKVAKAMVEGQDLLIKGGNFEFDKSWYHCPSCKAKFNMASKKDQCPVCNSKELVSLNEYYQKEEV
jgi:predicted DNA-binding protein (UPF0251 family)